MKSYFFRARSRAFFEYTFSLNNIDHFNFGANKIDVAGYNIQEGHFRWACTFFGSNLTDQQVHT